MDSTRPSEAVQRSIIASLLLWPDEIDTVTEVIGESDFVSEKYRDVFRAILSNPGADMVSIMPHVKTPGSELSQWTSEEFSASMLPRYCKELKEISTKAKIWEAVTEVRRNIEIKSSAELLELAASSLSIISPHSKTDPVSVSELCRRANKRLEARFNDRGQISGIPYGFQGLDNLTGGIHRQDLIIVAGRPSMGKTAFANNVLENACSLEYKGLSFSFEMPEEQIMDRMIASQGKVSLTRIRHGAFNDGDWGRMSKGFERINGMGLWIDDTPGLSLAEIRAKSRAQKKKHGLDLLCVDYLTLIRMEERDSRSRAVGEVSRGLKLLARELDCAVIAICQLSRSVDGRQDKRPTMSDLRDSGEIEQDADVIIFPFRPAAYCQKCRDRVNDVDHDLFAHDSIGELILEKQRNGPRNVSVPVTWIGEFQRFEHREES